MTVSLFTRNKVKDFRVWKRLMDESTEFVAQQGVIATNVLCDPNDSTWVIVHHQFEDVSTANAFMGLVNSDLFRKGDPVEKGGVILETLEMWLGEDV